MVALFLLYEKSTKVQDAALLPLGKLAFIFNAFLDSESHFQIKMKNWSKQKNWKSFLTMYLVKVFLFEKK